MPDPHALRHDEKWRPVCCDLDVCLTEGGTPVGYNTYGEGIDSIAVSSTVAATTSKVFTSASRLKTSYGHEGGVARGVKVPGYCGQCFPLEWVDNVMSEGNPIVTDNCLFALNDGNCVGYAESSRACWNEVVVFDNGTDDGHDNVKGNCKDMANKRNAPFFESNDTSVIDGEAGKVTTCGHRSNPITKNPSRTDHYSAILDGLDQRGLEVGDNLEINSCGGLGDHRPYPGSEPYESDELCQGLSEASGKKVKVYTELVLQKSGANGQARSERGFFGKGLTGEFDRPAASMECNP